MLNANVEWDVPFLRALTLTGRVVNTGKQAANLTNTLFLPSWTRLDLGVRYVAVVGDRPLTLRAGVDNVARSEEHTSELQSLMRISYAVFCLKNKRQTTIWRSHTQCSDHSTARQQGIND